MATQYKTSDGKVHASKEAARSYAKTNSMGYQAVSSPSRDTSRSSNRVQIQPVKTSPAVVTSEPARKAFAEAQQGINDLSNQLQGRFPDLVMAPGGIGWYGAGMQGGQVFKTREEAMGLSPDAKKEQRATEVLDRIEPKKTPQQEAVDEYKTEAERISAEKEKIYDSYISSINKIMKGSFPLTPEQSAYVNAIQQSFETAKQQQQIANKNYEGAIVNAGIAAGRNRYAPEIEAGNIQSAINAGIAKIQELDIKAIKAVYEAKQAISEKNYQHATNVYKEARSYLDEKQEIIQNTYDNVLKGLEDERKAEADAFKMAKEQGLMLSSVIYNQLGDDEAENARIIQEYADAYGIEDPNILLSALNEYEVEQQKAIKWETRTVDGQQVRFGFDQAGNMVAATVLGAADRNYQWDKETGQVFDPKTGQVYGGSVEFGVGEYISSLGQVVSGSPHKNGLDIAGQPGTPIPAASEGEVVFAGKNGDWGNQVRIKLEDGRVVAYNHLSDINVSVGDSVNAGDILGGMGNTGRVLKSDTGTAPSAKELAEGRGTHLDVTMYDKNGKMMKLQDVVNFLNSSTAVKPEVETQEVDSQVAADAFAQIQRMQEYETATDSWMKDVADLFKVKEGLESGDFAKRYAEILKKYASGAGTVKAWRSKLNRGLEYIATGKTY